MLCSHSSFSLWHSVECKGYVPRLYTLVCNVWRHQIWARRKEAEIRLEFLLFHFWTRPLILFLFPHSKCNALFRRRTGRKRSPCDWRVWCGQWKEFPEFLHLPLKNVTGSGGREGEMIKSSRTLQLEEASKRELLRTSRRLLSPLFKQNILRQSLKQVAVDSKCTTRGSSHDTSKRLSKQIKLTLVTV